MPEVLIHVSRPIRWDSDHVVVLNDDTVSLAREIVRCGYLDRVFLATDYFDASINRIGAWVIGGRSVKKALLFALLEPVSKLKALEKEGKGAAKLALMEEAKTMPFGAVWDYFCLSSGVPAGASWIDEMTSYEAKVLSKRG
jgi:L-rhamnose isomerase